MNLRFCTFTNLHSEANMKNRNPSCADFIVEAIREVRPKIPRMKQGVASGVSLQKIFNIATTVYSAEEFTKTVDALMRNSTVILSAETYTWSERDKETGAKFSKHVVSRLVHAPSKELCGEDYWWVDENGKPLKPPIEAVSGRAHNSIRLHIKADGLPERIARLATNIPLKRNHSATEAVAAKIL